MCSVPALSCGARTGLFDSDSVRAAGTFGGSTNTSRGGQGGRADAGNGGFGGHLGGSGAGAGATSGASATAGGATTGGTAGECSVATECYPTACGGKVCLGSATDVAVGDGHACAVTAASTFCWGSNLRGQLGDGTFNSSFLPVMADSIQATSGVMHVAAGQGFSMDLISDGSVHLWGNGQATYSSFFLPAIEPPPAIAIAAGRAHACVVVYDGTVLCRGSNSAGQLGDGSLRDSAVPVQVTNLKVDVAHPPGLSAGSQHTCVLSSSDGVRCWGDNSRGQLGDGTFDSSRTPVQVPNFVDADSSVIAIAAGTEHTCAVVLWTAGVRVNTSAVMCWGDNTRGQLSVGLADSRSATPLLVPMTIAPNFQVVSIAAGEYHTCVLINDGSTQCWGDNSVGQLGFDSGGRPSRAQTAINWSKLDLKATAIAAGVGETCVVLLDSTVRCWGSNSTGQLGVNGLLQSTTPVAVSR